MKSADFLTWTLVGIQRSPSIVVTLQPRLVSLNKYQRPTGSGLAGDGDPAAAAGVSRGNAGWRSSTTTAGSARREPAVYGGGRA
jgi:hypothetical protein